MRTALDRSITSSGSVPEETGRHARTFVEDGRLVPLHHMRDLAVGAVAHVAHDREGVAVVRGVPVCVHGSVGGLMCRYTHARIRNKKKSHERTGTASW